MTKPVKILGVLSFVFFVLLWYSYNARPTDRDPTESIGKSGVDKHNQHDVATKPPEPTLLVDVYYECLCPDSKYFVLHELGPAVEKVGSLLTVRLWPYGKAATEKTEQGDCEQMVY